MQIENVKPAPKLVEDWEFTFRSGQVAQVTIDEEAGDSVEFSALSPMIHLKRAERPSPLNPEYTMSQDELWVVVTNILTIRRQKRVEEALSIEDKENLKKTLHEIVGSTNTVSGA